MVNIVVIFFSGYGHTARQAEAVIEGARSAPNTDTHRVVVDADGLLRDGDWSLLEAADAIIFGCPTYMGSIPWQFKRFIDASSKVWAAQGWKDKIAAGFTNSGSMNGDKSQTLNYLYTLAMQHAMIWVGTGLMPANLKTAQRDDVNFLGAFGGAMSQSPADASAEEAPCQGDLATARRFGARVAETARRWAHH